MNPEAPACLVWQRLMQTSAALKKLRLAAYILSAGISFGISNSFTSIAAATNLWFLTSRPASERALPAFQKRNAAAVAIHPFTTLIIFRISALILSANLTSSPVNGLVFVPALTDLQFLPSRSTRIGTLPKGFRLCSIKCK